MSTPDVSVTWSDRSGDAWVREEARVDATLSPLGLGAIERLGLVAGEAVVDIGCGAGQTVLQLGERVGGSGRVLGVDISEVMLGRARQRVAQAGLTQVQLELANAETYAFEAERYDALFSRFGVMFFEDTRAACERMLAALKPGGRIAFVCWQALERNDWALRPLAAVQSVLKLETLPDFFLQGKPGPFRFGDPEPFCQALRAAGARDVRAEALEREVQLGAATTLEEAVAYCLEVGPAARLLAGTEPSVREAVTKALRVELEPLSSARGVWTTSRAWLVSARR
ncbi:MAG: class I SAM-dependent methyltransferase [Polyangiaceae bacterium]